jgi:hypothetical protein
MKNLLIFIYLFTMVFMSAYAQDSSPKRLGFGLYGGIQLPEEYNLDSGPWFGVFVNLPTGLGWSLQFEYNFWKAIDESRVPDEDVFVSEFPLLVAYKWEISNAYLQMLFGPGIASSGSTILGGDRDVLVSFDAGLKIGLAITRDFDGFIQVRKQWTLTLKMDGGDLYEPYLIGIGIQFKLNHEIG